ncbi:MAG: AMP-binding protein, partial [Candidatus Aminicenantes bacterium]
MNFNHFKNIYESFEEQVKKRPEEIAARDNQEQITFRNLYHYANQITRMLIHNHAIAGDITAVDIRKPIEMAAGILGILKAGGIYMPLDLTRPGDYIDYQLQHSNAKYLLTHSRRGTLQNSLKFNGKILSPDPIDTGDSQEGNQNNINSRKTYPASEEEMENPLGIIYFSHSSGRPQAITCSHRKIADWMRFNSERLNIDFTSTLFISSFTMKSAFPLWLVNLTTASGGSVYFYDPPPKPDFTELRNLMHRIRFTSIVCPLYYLKNLIESEEFKQVFSQHIANIVTRGEENFNVEAFKKFLKEKKIRWHNYYGFPEMNMITTLTTGEPGFKHIGKPGSGTCAYILNQARREVAIGLPGDLYVSGIGIMNHYHENQELNSAHFFENPIKPAEKMLKTGYRAYWLPDGKLSLLGRADNLVNINGTRVAPAVVEAALFRHSQVKDCAVTAKDINRNSSRLTAYLVLKEDITLNSLEEFLKNILPQEYFPIGYVKANSLPRTPDGAVDRKYLDQLEPLDSLQVQALEKRINEFPQIKQAAVLVKEKTEPPVPLYIKDYVLDLPPVPLNKKEESRMPQQPVPGSESSQHSPPAIIHGQKLVWEEGDPKTLPQALKRAASQHGENGVQFIQADGSTHFQSYASLLEEAEQMLAGLKKLGLKPQDKVIFQFNRNEDFTSALWGCMLAGAVPVPLTVSKSFTKTTNETEILKRVCQLLDKPIILTNRLLAKSIRSLSGDYRVEDIESLRNNPPDKNWHQVLPEDLAIILFTSGSTGIPKGVMQCHRSIISREKSTTMHNGGGLDEVSINWMPLEHVGGVVMTNMNDIYIGCQQIQVSTEYILADPLRWLDIIHQYRGTITWAPNFAYALVS